MKKPLHHITDHAVIRYLERVEGVDIDAVRFEIGRKVDRAVKAGASAAYIEGFRYAIEEGRVVTVVEQHKPDRRFCNGRGIGDG